jgi:hypothetical protein
MGAAFKLGFLIDRKNAGVPLERDWTQRLEGICKVCAARRFSVFSADGRHNYDDADAIVIYGI